MAMDFIVHPQRGAHTRTPMKSVPHPSQERKKDKLIAFDDTELSDWVLTLGEERSGRFLCALAEAVMKADPEEYSVIRPALMNLKRRYAEAKPGREEFASAVTGKKILSRNLPRERGEQ
jgi:hypothetical protein